MKMLTVQTLWAHILVIVEKDTAATDFHVQSVSVIVSPTWDEIIRIIIKLQCSQGRQACHIHPYLLIDTSYA